MANKKIQKKLNHQHIYQKKKEVSSKLTICITYFIHYISRLQQATKENQPPEVGLAKVVNNVQKNHNTDVASSKLIRSNRQLHN